MTDLQNERLASLESVKYREEAMVGEYGLYYDKDKMSAQEEEEEEAEHPDIRHVAPQHRQYLGEEILTRSTPQLLAIIHKSRWSPTLLPYQRTNTTLTIRNKFSLMISALSSM